MNRLIEIQQKIKVPKGQFNSFGGYKYRSCEDILESVKPLLKAQNLLLVLNDEMVSLNDRYYVKATATIFDENGKEIIHTTAFAREEENKKGMDGSQITGASSSYARKYALNGLFGIDDTKDSDATNKHGKEEPKEPDMVEEHISNIKACQSRNDLELYWATLEDKDKKNAKILKVFKEMGSKYPKVELVRESKGEIKEVQSA